ncbi:MAG: dTDP-glucose 4,6-dehydratase, partial [Bradymonadaceae bacterium]
EGDVADSDLVGGLLEEEQPRGIYHLAAESHVDRSIDGPLPFVQSNVVGTSVLLEETLEYWSGLPEGDRGDFRFLHVSTDEVYGELGENGFFDEETPYDPSSPYAASKASADMFVRAWHRTYGLPVLITNCGNNYGPRQYPEKLIPVVITKALRGDSIPVYGDGSNVRDWIYVDDHVRGLRAVFDEGEDGETYNIGARCEKQNIELVRKLCQLLDELVPDPAVDRHASLITFVEDRPGHDFRYAIDPEKIETELGWSPEESFESGLRKTVRWYLDNLDWCSAVLEDAYDLERLGERLSQS